MNEFIPFSEARHNEPMKQEVVQPQVDKNTLEVNKAKDKFINKHNLRELRNDQIDGESKVCYYYDHKSNTVYEVNNFKPVVFMKSDLATSNRIKSYNGIITS